MDFFPIKYFSNYMEANILAGRLQQEGIDCWLKDENLVTIMPIWTQAAGGIKLMVRENQVNEAKQLLQQFDKEKRSHFTCPHCNSGNIELVSSYKEPANWVSVLLGFLAFNYAMPVKKWKCFHCGTEFKEPKEV